ncbi:MAG: flagellar basal body P-ring protein FlgI [Planctomycetes bacterium]|nr:flagellar basal body P-ring protein FlgI [Planctomycetota bacterium]
MSHRRAIHPSYAIVARRRTSASRPFRVWGTLLGVGLLGGLMGGCGGFIWQKESRGRADLGVAAREMPFANSVAIRDTIGAYTYYDGLTPQRVSGFGLVVGLGRNGSRDCPRDIYSQLVQTLYKRQRTAIGVVGEVSSSPEDLIDSLDTAVVVVRGELPAAAGLGKTFEVSVIALPGTQTKSLRGGRLLPTDLTRVRRVAAGRSVTGKTLARAAGPLLLNPFAQEKELVRRADLRGTIVGGGLVVNERHTRLVLMSPSYPRVRGIRDRINEHFSGPSIVADATSPSFIELRCPKAYRDDVAHFLGLIRGLYLKRNPQLDALRARKLGAELLDPAAPHERIALCFEGLGVTALPVLRELYAHPSGHVAFYAAAAGLRLEDHLAGDVMAMIAGRAGDEFRFRAIRALARAEGMANTTHALRRLLGDDDARVCVAAYDALVKRRDDAVDSYLLGSGNFVLDLIPGAGKRLVYVRRTGQRRIALFGGDLHCTTPVFYRAADGTLTITAQAEDDQLTILRTVLATGNVSPAIPASLSLSRLILLMGRSAGVDMYDNVTGLGLDYNAVVHAVYRLCHDKSVNANFMLEQPNVAELFGPAGETERPESE